MAGNDRFDALIEKHIPKTTSNETTIYKLP